MYFCLGLFVLNACTLEEDAIHQHKRDEKIKVERQSFNELMKTNQFSKAMSKVPKKKVQVTNSLGRTQMEEQYGFTIVDTPVKIIEFEGKTTYTFQIIKDENTDNKIENLVLYQTPIDDKIGYVVKYNSEIGTPKTEEEISEDGISELETLTSTGTLSQKTTIYVVYLVASCVLKPGDPAYCGGDPSNPNFTSACQSYHYDVITFGGGGDISGNGGGDDTSGPGTGSGTGEGGGGSGNGDNPEPVDPTIIPNHGATSPLNCGTCPILDENDDDTPCIKLFKLFKDNPLVKTGANALKGKLDIDNFESGFTLNKNATEVNIMPSSKNGTRITRYRIWENSFGGMHNHPISEGDEESSYPMFSPGDLAVLVRLDYFHPTTNAQDTPFTLNIMVTDDFTYAIVPNDATTLASISSKFLNQFTLDKFNSELEREYVKLGNPWDVSQRDLAKLYLEFINTKYNLNISLFRIPNDKFYENSNFWQSVTLDANSPNGVKIENCN